MLEKGRYRFEGAVCTSGVEPLAFGKSEGASLHVLDTTNASAGNLVADHGWGRLQVEFELAASEQEIELACELRARAGEAWFDLQSLQLVRLPGGETASGR